MSLRGIPLAWLQLKHEKLRLVAAVLGISFAVVLVYMQAGFRAALFESAVRYHHKLDFDLVMMSSKTDYIGRPESIPRRRLHQVTGLDEVEAVTGVYLGQGSWRNPVELNSTRNILVLGFDPSARGFERFGIEQHLDTLKQPDVALFDIESRPEFGPMRELLAKGPVELELNGRQITVSDTYTMGTSFGIDGGLITSDLNFRRMFPGRQASHIDLGLIHLAPGTDTAQALERVRNSIAGDVEIYDRQGFVDRELNYWNNATPIGYVFSFGVVIGLVVGLIIVYQILFSDVQDHLQEYATLKAMGYTQSFLSRLVLKESAILAVAGFVPGTLLSLLLYSEASGATNLPINMTVERALFVLTSTLVMCALSGLIALRKLKSVDPAEVF